MSEFYDRYNMLKKSKRVTDSEVSRQTGIPRSCFSDWKAGRTKQPSPTVVQKLADYFNVSVKYLITGESEPEAPQDVKDMAKLFLELQKNERVRNIADYLITLDDDALFVVETFLNYKKGTDDVAPND